MRRSNTSISAYRSSSPELSVRARSVPRAPEVSSSQKVIRSSVKAGLRFAVRKNTAMPSFLVGFRCAAKG
jgi:hypothetical protein